jgi:hypothetical protein
MKREAFNRLVETYISGEENNPNDSGLRLGHYSEAELVYKGITARRSRRTGNHEQVAIVLATAKDQSATLYHILHADTAATGGLMVSAVAAEDVITNNRGYRIPAGFPEGEVFIPEGGDDPRLRLGGRVLNTEYMALFPEQQEAGTFDTGMAPSERPTAETTLPVSQTLVGAAA